MIDLEDIDDFFKEVFGNKVTISSQIDASTEKEKLQFILENVETIIDRDYKLAEITNIDFTSYSEPYFIVIENLIAMHYGEEITSAIMFYLYGNKDDDGNEFPYDEDEEGNQTFIRTFEDLWAIVGQRFSQN
jgi:hypothetical protein